MELQAKNGRLRIRRMKADDAAAHLEAVRESSATLCRWMPWCKADYSIKDSRAFGLFSAREWKKGTEFNFAIVDAKTGAFLGNVGLNHINREYQFANLGYWVRLSRTRQGIAPAAVRMVAGLGLNKLGFRRLEIVVDVKNKFSQRVAEKAGARREGLLRKRLMHHGASRDAVMYSLVAEDLE